MKHQMIKKSSLDFPRVAKIWSNCLYYWIIAYNLCLTWCFDYACFAFKVDLTSQHGYTMCLTDKQKRSKYRSIFQFQGETYYKKWFSSWIVFTHTDIRFCTYDRNNNGLGNDAESVIGDHLNRLKKFPQCIYWQPNDQSWKRIDRFDETLTGIWSTRHSQDFLDTICSWPFLRNDDGNSDCCPHHLNTQLNFEYICKIVGHTEK